jgi:non-heme chloroperoxidase
MEKNFLLVKVKDMLKFKDIAKALFIAVAINPTAYAQEGTIEKSIRLSTGVTLNYAEYGKQGRAPIVLLHGYTDSWRSFENVIPKFSKDHYVVALTHRGHGGSSKPMEGYEIKDFATDVAAFISEKRLGKCIIVGHSLGGLIAQQFAISYPQHTRSIVLVATDASFADNPGVPEFIGEVNKLSDPIAYDFAASFQRSTIYKPVDSVQVEVFIRESLKVPSSIWKAIGSEIMKADFSRELENILVPALILWGNRDSFCPWNDQGNLSAAIPHATLKVYKDIGHAIHWENGDQFVRDIESFAGNLK